MEISYLKNKLQNCARLVYERLHLHSLLDAWELFVNYVTKKTILEFNLNILNSMPNSKSKLRC